MSPAPTIVELAFAEAAALDAPLNERLKLIAEAHRTAAPSYTEALDRLADRLDRAAAGEGAPREGEKLPSFLLPDESGRLTALEEFLAVGPVVVAFLRGHWCPYCRLNAVGFREIEAEIAARGARLAAIMPEKREFAQALKRESGSSFPILSDMDAAYATSLNLTIWVGAELEKVLIGTGRNFGDFYGNSSFFLPIPSVFVVRRDGTIVWRRIDPDYRRRADLGDLLQALDLAR